MTNEFANYFYTIQIFNVTKVLCICSFGLGWVSLFCFFDFAFLDTTNYFWAGTYIGTVTIALRERLFGVKLEQVRLD